MFLETSPRSGAVGTPRGRKTSERLSSRGMDDEEEDTDVETLDDDQVIEKGHYQLEHLGIR